MSERKWTGVILGILLLIGLFMFGWNYWDLSREHNLTHNNCTVKFKYMYNVDTGDDGYACANNELALCLCNSYLKIKSRSDSNKIMQIYQRYGLQLKPDSAQYESYKHFDTILKYKRDVFDIGCWD